MAFAGFLLMIPPLIWLFYRHSVQRIPGGESSRFLIPNLILSIHLLRLLRMVARDLGYRL
jgi:hypothetical protein